MLVPGIARAVVGHASYVWAMVGNVQDIFGGAHVRGRLEPWIRETNH